MKKYLLFLSVFLITLFAQAQPKPVKLDKSPLDVAYYPVNFAHDRKAGDEAIVKVYYSRPFKKNREVFGKLISYGKVWRVGANEAAEIKFFKDVKIGEETLKAGTYSLFAIPEKGKWTIIFSSDLDYWGAYRYKEENDVLRAEAEVMENSSSLENFTIAFEKEGEGAVMYFGWDKTLAKLPIEF